MKEVLEFLIKNGYLVLFAWVFAEQVGLPLPAIPMLLAAGVLSGMGHMSVGWALLWAVLASVLADLLWFELGRRKGTGVLKLLCRISLEPDSCVRRTEDVFAKYGPRALIVAKFIPGLNVAAPPMSAVVRMRLWKFLLFDAIGAVLWVVTFGWLGYLFSHQLEDVAAYIGRIGTVLVWLVLALVGAYIYRRFRHRRAFLKELEIARITPEELKAELDRGEDVFIVDLRHPLDFLPQPYTIGNALRMAPAEIETRHEEIPRDRDIVLYCT
jgi:membrane protein DedA with SNARE-associated domain